MSEKFTKWDAADYLENSEDILHYLNACIDEDPGDGSLIRVALGDIARAKNISQISKEIGMSREGLYKALSEKGNPSFSAIIKIAHSLGLSFHFTQAT